MTTSANISINSATVTTIKNVSVIQAIDNAINNAGLKNGLLYFKIDSKGNFSAYALKCKLNKVNITSIIRATLKARISVERVDAYFNETETAKTLNARFSGLSKLLSCNYVAYVNGDGKVNTGNYYCIEHIGYKNFREATKLTTKAKREIFDNCSAKLSDAIDWNNTTIKSMIDATVNMLSLKIQHNTAVEKAFEELTKHYEAITVAETEVVEKPETTAPAAKSNSKKSNKTAKAEKAA